MKPARLAALAGAVLVAWVVVFAGEYSTFDWLTLRVVLDSLNRLAHDLETNPAAQERAARERFGVIRNGEILYRLVPRSEATRSSRP